MLKNEQIFQSKTDFSDIPKIRIFVTNINTSFGCGGTLTLQFLKHLCVLEYKFLEYYQL